MFAPLKNAARSLARRIGAGGGHRVYLIRAQVETDSFGRIASRRTTSRRITAAVEQGGKFTVESDPGAHSVADCTVIVPGQPSLDPVHDRVTVNGVTYRIARIQPDALGANTRLHLTQAR